jgi:hypothetical protein
MDVRNVTIVIRAKAGRDVIEAIPVLVPWFRAAKAGTTYSLSEGLREIERLARSGVEKWLVPVKADQEKPLIFQYDQDDDLWLEWDWFETEFINVDDVDIDLVGLGDFRIIDPDNGLLVSAPQRLRV